MTKPKKKAQAKPKAKPKVFTMSGQVGDRVVKKGEPATDADITYLSSKGLDVANYIK